MKYKPTPQDKTVRLRRNLEVLSRLLKAARSPSVARLLRAYRETSTDRSRLRKEILDARDGEYKATKNAEAWKSRYFATASLMQEYVLRELRKSAERAFNASVAAELAGIQERLGKLPFHDWDGDEANQ